SIPEISVADLPPDLQLELDPDSIFVHSPGKENGSAARALTAGPGAPLQRGSGGWEAIVAAGSPHPGLSTKAWISLSVLIGVFFVLSVFMIDPFFRCSLPDRS